MPAVTFFLAYKKEKNKEHRLSENDSWREELNSLYRYQYLLLSALQVKNQFLGKLAAINYDNMPYEPFFTPFEITILKNQIIAGMEALEEQVIKQNISSEDFQHETDQLSKRIDLLTMPMTEIKHKLGVDYNETKIVA
jgi:hypothetical protein